MRQRTLLFCAGAGLAVFGVLAAEKAGEGDAQKGKAVFAQQCLMCHNATSTERKMGPGLKGLFKKQKLANGKPATEQNIRRQIDEGGGGMPAYKDMLTQPERNDLVGFLKTL